MFGIQRKRHTPIRAFSSTPAVSYMRKRDVPLSALHVSLYRPSNFQTTADSTPLRRAASVQHATAEKTQQSIPRQAAQRAISINAIFSTLNYFFTQTISPSHYPTTQNIGPSSRIVGEKFNFMMATQKKISFLFLRNLWGAQESRRL